MIRTRVLLAALAALVATKAGALSCGPGDPLQALSYAREASEPMVVLHGRLALDESRLPHEAPWLWPWQDHQGSIPARPVPTRFEGVRFSVQGTQRLDADVRIEPTCRGDYCGAIYEGTYLLFARETPTGLAIEVGPCGGPAFGDPDAALLDTVAACLAGGTCPP